MSEKRCLACHALLSGEAECPVCGNPDYIVPNMTEKRLQTVQSWADEHRQEKLNGLAVEIYAYSRSEKDNKVIENPPERVKICDAKMLSFENITWLAEKFARIEDENGKAMQATLTVILSKQGKEWKKKEISFMTPTFKDFWYVGAVLTEGLGVSIVVGNKKETNLRLESIALI